MGNGILETIDEKLKLIIEEYLVDVREKKAEGFRDLDMALWSIAQMLIQVINTMSLNNDFLLVINPLTTPSEKAQAQQRYSNPSSASKKDSYYGLRDNINTWVGNIDENEIGRTPSYVSDMDRPEWKANRRIEILGNNVTEHQKQLAATIEMIGATIYDVKELMDEAIVLSEQNALLRDSMTLSIPEEQRRTILDKYRVIAERERQIKERDKRPQSSLFRDDYQSPNAAAFKQDQPSVTPSLTNAAAFKQDQPSVDSSYGKLPPSIPDLITTDVLINSQPAGDKQEPIMSCDPYNAENPEDPSIGDQSESHHL